MRFRDTLLRLLGATSGEITLKAAAVAGTNTLTLPAGTTDFSATGGTSQVVKQTSAGGALTVAQLATSDMSDFIAITAQTPAVTAGSGTFTTATASENVIRLSNRILFVIGSVTITTVGTGATSINVALPTVATFGARAGSANAVGRGSDGTLWAGGATGSAPGTMNYTKYDGTGTVGSGFVLQYSYFMYCN